MSMQRQGSDEAVAPRADRPPDGSAGPYTGVVIIHGIGDQKRNATLQEALNALTYWFNHEAGLDLKSDGMGRIWLTAHFTDDPDPDARAARATMELVAPADLASSPDNAHAARADGDGARLRLEFCEVWWAESFGLPKVGPALSWARVQFREQLTRVLLPAGIGLGPAQAARRAPACQTPQALTYQPQAAVCRAEETTPDAEAAPSKSVGRPSGGVRLRRMALGVALWAYDLVQYVWKLAQWLVLTPVITLLLLLLGPVRLLARIPFLRSTLLTSATAAINYVVLHWVASMQVYLLDYSRSAAIRQRFECELEDFLADRCCERIVVIAHSMGTVISYESLTTLLNLPQWQEGDAGQKRITYICLAQALRRMWLLPRSDPRRLLGVLPERVRWLHFWARYDPVAVGPLYPGALPLPQATAPSSVGHATTDYQALSARLKRCENVDVVNTDSIFSDHTAYWQNLEQVVGPIALELVTGHPALERVVREHLVTRDKVLLRRWRVAWRALVALAGGFGLAALLLVLNARNGGGVVQAMLNGLGTFLSSQSVETSLDNSTFGLYSKLVAYLATCTQAGTPNACSGLESLGQNPYLTLPYVLAYYLNGNNVATIVTALVAVVIGIQVTDRLVAAPSPFAFQSAAGAVRRVRSVFVLSALAMALLVVSYFFVITPLTNISRTPYNPAQVPIVASISFWSFGLFELVGAMALAAGLVDAARNRQWGWAAGIVILIAVLFGGMLYGDNLASLVASAVLLTTLVGCVVALVVAVRSRQPLWAAVLLLSALMIEDVLRSSLLTPFGAYRIVFLAILLAPMLLYGLWVGPFNARTWSAGAGGSARTLALAIACLAAVLPLLAVARYNGARLLFLAALPVAALAVGLTAVDAVRRRRWVWLASLLLPTLALLVVFTLIAAFAGPAQLVRHALVVTQVIYLALLVPALSYSLWSDMRATPVLVEAHQAIRSGHAQVIMRTVMVRVLAVVLASVVVWGAIGPHFALGQEVTLHIMCRPDDPGCDLGHERDIAIGVLTHRLVLTLGIGSPEVMARAVGTDEIVVQLPYVIDERQIPPLLQARGELDFLDTGSTPLALGQDVSGLTCTTSCQPGQYQIVFTGNELDPNSIAAGLDPQTNQPIVTFAFSGAAKNQFADYTRTHVGQYLTTTLDDKVINVATINGEIVGNGQIQGLPSTQNAQQLALYLKSRSLPVTVTSANVAVVLILR